MSPERRAELDSLIKSGLSMLPPECLVDMIMEGLKELTEPELLEFITDMQAVEESIADDSSDDGSGDVLVPV